MGLWEKDGRAGVGVGVRVGVLGADDIMFFFFSSLVVLRSIDRRP